MRAWGVGVYVLYISGKDTVVCIYTRRTQKLTFTSKFSSGKYQVSHIYFSLIDLKYLAPVNSKLQSWAKYCRRIPEIS